MKRWLLARMATGLMLFGVIGTANAVSTYYTTAAAWFSTVSGVATDTYESYGWASSGGDIMSGNGSVILSGIIYSFPEAIFGCGSALTYDAPYLTGSYLEWQYSPNPLTIVLPMAVRAVSFNYGEFLGTAGRTLSISLGNGDLTSVPTIANSYAFFGVVSDVPFTSLVLNSSGDFAVMDDFSYATVIPEPAPIYLFGAGMAALLLRRLRQPAKP
jgi:hypothetical protein